MTSIRLFTCRRKKTNKYHFIVSSIVKNILIDSRTKNKICQNCSFRECKLTLYYVNFVEKYGHLILNHEI